MQAVVWVLISTVGVLVGMAFGLWHAQRPTTDTADKFKHLHNMQADAKILFGSANRLPGTHVV